VRPRRRQPVLLDDEPPYRFPDPASHDSEGLVAFGGDLAPGRLLAAYSAGIFPWFNEETVPLWWSPDPRAVLDPASLHVSRSLARTIRRGRFTLTWDRAFADVMRGCGDRPDSGTWITDEMFGAYCELHRLGHAHSLEVWVDGALAAGTYGVHVGGLFAAESMFHRVTDMSKVALVALVHTLFRAGIELLDVQFLTEHLETMGVYPIPRADYLARLAAVRDKPVMLGGLTPVLGG